MHQGEAMRARLPAAAGAAWQAAGHVGCLLETAAQRQALLSAALAQGQQAGARVLYLVPAEEKPRLAALAAAVGGPLAVQPYAGCEAGRQALLSFLEAALAAARQEGLAGLRLVVEAPPQAGEAGWGAVEAWLQRRCQEGALRALCLYDARQPPTALLQALCAHPQLLLDGQLEENPAGMPPEALQSAEGAALQGQAVLRQLRAQRQLRQQLQRSHEQLQREVAQRQALEQRLRQERAYLAALHEATLGLLNRRELSRMLEAVLTRAGKLLGTSHGFIYVRDEASGELVKQVALGVGREHAAPRLACDQGVAGRVLRERQPCLVTAAAPEQEGLPGLRREQFGAVLAVPLLASEDAIGVMGLIHVEAGRGFARDDAVQLGRFAQLVALALVNAQLWTAVQQEVVRRKRLEVQIRQVQRVQAVAALARGIAQDFNTILGAMVSVADRALHEVPRDSTARRHLQEVLQAGRRARRLVQRLLTFSRRAEAGLNLTHLF